MATSTTILACTPRARIVSPSSMNTQTLQIKSITLQAREEKRLPTGQATTPSRDIGFASVFVRLENPKEKDVNLIIKSIKIQNVSDGSLQMTSPSPQEILLRPLENAENVFHLKNKTGYSGQGQVKAIVTYQLGDQVAVIESSPVEVNRH
ncbi:MAG TPA: hypothetical protein V6D14_03975 [Coleofasciculaceae cyanobacterium]